MFIAKVENGSITVGDYRELFPNTSFPPSGPSAEFLQEVGCKPVNLFKPHDRNTEKLVPCNPYVEGDWVYTVQVAPLTEEELMAARNSAAASQRAFRNKLLSDCDWTQLPDAPVDTQAWANYRQALRDVTSQTGFPWDIQWPEKPQ
jgi:hypothetical protein